MNWEPDRLDDQGLLTEGDPSGMLRAVAASAAQIRTSRRAALESALPSIARDGRPRAIVVAGLGGAGTAGDILNAVCGYGAPLPVLTVRSYRLPGWIGATDLVIVVSRSGRTEETLAVAAEAVRRGCRLLAVGGPDSPLQAVARQAGAPFVPVEPDGSARAALWSLTVPLIVAAAELGLIVAGEDVFEETARRLEDIAHRCRPASESFINPGKSLAMEIAETVPMIWGSTPLTAVAARRWASQLNENGKYPATWGEIPGSDHSQLAVLDGPLARRDVFADDGGRAVRLFVLRDVEEHRQVTRRCEAVLRLAEDRDVRVTQVTGEGTHPLERLAVLIELGDFASTYLALGYGIDPSAVAAITELKARVSQ
ncbi:glucose/mannose-6-phosphate isomerase [Streptosporangium becharense]|uniref:Glucose/mannose-6-phosphate isomerase n=1 Tax=Streptosporangium becharense TaxID=1816182 RepID=A0A7W9IES9_9ACTN|nr:SIS domain-containing protein [Streptosporangium becharense]MBB2909711.1 glucose/mannose-6-phosphate isomerase [Streptosporangium becharense]MBB5819333.1 glucose/mannose-6-phosphate isomerase [Streptosporangium becharense]